MLWLITILNETVLNCLIYFPLSVSMFRPQKAVYLKEPIRRNVLVLIKFDISRLSIARYIELEQWLSCYKILSEIGQVQQLNMVSSDLWICRSFNYNLTSFDLNLTKEFEFTFSRNLGNNLWQSGPINKDSEIKSVSFSWETFPKKSYFVS